MKKLLVFMILALVLLGCADNSLKSTPASQVSEKLINLESAVVVFGQSTCAACTDYKPVLQEVLKNYPNVPIMYVETDKDNRSDVTSLVERFLPEATVTPITYFFVNGELVGFERGAFRYSQLKAFLVEKGYISE
jgi:thiol-disulfide isomerase/thioredoxin